jgi:hypothetical protein
LTDIEKVLHYRACFMKLSLEKRERREEGLRRRWPVSWNP